MWFLKTFDFRHHLKKEEGGFEQCLPVNSSTGIHSVPAGATFNYYFIIYKNK